MSLRFLIGLSSFLAKDFLIFARRFHYGKENRVRELVHHLKWALIAAALVEALKSLLQLMFE